MGKRGPKRTPTSILDQRNRPTQQDRSGEPKPIALAPVAPDWMEPEAKVAWEYLAPKMERLGILTEIDGNAFARYCQTWAKWRTCEDFLAQHGDVYAAKNAKGKVTGFVQHPQVNTAIKLDAALFAMEKQFGLTPSARAGLSVSDIPPQSPADAASELIRVALARAN